MKPMQGAGQKASNFNGRTMSNIDDYARKVKSLLEQIIRENSYGNIFSYLKCKIKSKGVTSDRLYTLLSQRLGSKFEFALFNC
jgi:hypothetical protein